MKKSGNSIKLKDSIPSYLNLDSGPQKYVKTIGSMGQAEPRGDDEIYDEM